jgi:hypothetical protein
VNKPKKKSIEGRPVMLAHQHTLETAKRFHAAGYSLIPIRADGSKAPALERWKDFQRVRADMATMGIWFNDDRRRLSDCDAELRASFVAAQGRQR